MIVNVRTTNDTQEYTKQIVLLYTHVDIKLIDSYNWLINIIFI